MGEREVAAFLTSLATERKVAASTQNQALAAILFLYKHVLQVELAWVDGVVRAKRPVRLPVVLTRGEVSAVLAYLEGVPWLTASLMYGSGLRLMETARLRVTDVEFRDAWQRPFDVGYGEPTRRGPRPGRQRPP